MITLETRVRLPQGVLFRELAGEAVLLETCTGRYFGLNEVGTRIWSLLAGGADLAAVHGALLLELDVAPGHLREDLVGFVRELADHRLVEIDE